MLYVRFFLYFKYQYTTVECSRTQQDKPLTNTKHFLPSKRNFVERHLNAAKADTGEGRRQKKKGHTRACVRGKKNTSSCFTTRYTPRRPRLCVSLSLTLFLCLSFPLSLSLFLPLSLSLSLLSFHCFLSLFPIQSGSEMSNM